MTRQTRAALTLVVALSACLLACGGSGPSAPFDTSHPDADLDTAVDDSSTGGDTSSVDDTGPADTPDAADPRDAAAPAPSLWTQREAFEPAGAWVDGHPAAFARISGWTTHVEGEVVDRPGTSHRGGYGTGNGHAFALFAMTDPLNTLHGLTTPTYERGPRFFGDYAIRVAPADPPQIDPLFDTYFERESAAWSLSAPVVLTRGELANGLVLDTVDFAPVAAGPDAPHRTCIVRALSVRNEGTETIDGHFVHVTATNPVVNGPAAAGGATMVEQISDAKALTTGFTPDSGATTFDDQRTVSLALPTLAPGDEANPVLLHCGVAGADPMVLPNDLDPGAALDALAADHAAWDDRLVQVDVPDPMVADFIDGMKLTLRTQTAATGATCPMSQYTRTWARDNIGPVLAWLSFGAFEEVAATMDYIYGAVLLAGDLKNSYEADLDVSDPPAAPDWDAMGTFGTAVGAETPSYMVWIYGEHYLATGDLSRAQDRWGFLRRSLFAQAFSPEGLLPFTGDETFRAAMNATFGLQLESPHHLESWSANSSLLWLGASGHYTRLAEELGEADDVANAAAKHADVEASFLGRFILDDGCISALIDRPTDEVWPAPFEDVALKLGWVDWHPEDPQIQVDATDCLAARTSVGPGHFQSPVHELHEGNPFLPDLSEVYTGMLPGYALHALNDLAHPDTEAAFNRVGAALGTSGNLQEYQVGTDDSGLSIIYDPGGSLTDYTAKFRPWEGGIVVHAVMDYLLDWETDHPQRTLSVRPHLPNNWPGFTLTGLRSGDDRFDAEVAEGKVTVTSHAADDYELTITWDSTGTTETVTLEPGTIVTLTR